MTRATHGRPACWNNTLYACEHCTLEGLLNPCRLQAGPVLPGPPIPQGTVDCRDISGAGEAQNPTALAQLFGFGAKPETEWLTFIPSATLLNRSGPLVLAICPESGAVQRWVV